MSQQACDANIVDVEPIPDSPKQMLETNSDQGEFTHIIAALGPCLFEPWSGHESWREAKKEFRELGFSYDGGDEMEWTYPSKFWIFTREQYLQACLFHNRLLKEIPPPPPPPLIPEDLIPKEVQESASSFMPHTAKFIPILEPLSTATQTMLKPVFLAPSDRLLIAVKDDMKQFILEPFAVDAKGVRDPYRYASENARFKWLQKLPEKKEMKPSVDEPLGQYGKWRVAATDISVLVIYHNWPEDKIVFADPTAKAVYTYLLKRFLKQHRSQVIQARFKVDHTSPTMPKDFIEHPELPLSPAQKAGMLFTFEQEGSALFMEPGTGKTAVSIARMCLEAARCRTGHYLRDDGKPWPHMMRVLIVVPRQVRRNWEEEIQRFAVVPGKSAVLRGGEIKRTRTMIDVVRDEADCTFGAAICSYGVVEKTWEAISRVPWDLVILDESHLIKSHYTKRFEACREIINVSRRRMILTGSPIANSVMDLWSQLEFLGEGLSGFMVYANYKAFYGKWQLGGSGIEKLVGLKNVPLLQERLARMAFMISKKDAGLNLPEKTPMVIEVQMTSKQRKMYIDLQKQMALEIEDLLKDTTKRITADHILKKMLRLAQITAGHIVWDATFDEETGDLLEGKQVEQIDEQGKNPKVEALIELLTEEGRDPLGKTIIWALWHEDIRVIGNRLREAGIDFVEYYGETSDPQRKIAEDRFNKDPNMKVFLGSAACGGTGLNLLGYDPHNVDLVDTYCDMMIFFTQGWSAIERAQAEDRAHRRGTRCSLRIVDLVVPGTIDEEIRSRVRGKQSMAALVQDIQVILQRVCKSNVEADDE